jgi:hypothetical protein
VCQQRIATASAAACGFSVSVARDSCYRTIAVNLSQLPNTRV